jgi:mannose/fructose-specific phosphotransferase system component IIA
LLVGMANCRKKVVKISAMENAPWIIILTHGKAGEELIKSAEMILGPLKNVYAFSLLPGVPPEEYIKEVTETIKLAPEGSIILVDLFGGTPSNMAALLSKEYKISAVSGLNIAMLIEADSMRKQLRGEELAQKVVSTAKASCKNIIKELEAKQAQIKSS